MGNIFCKKEVEKENKRFRRNLQDVSLLGRSTALTDEWIQNSSVLRSLLNPLLLDQLLVASMWCPKKSTISNLNINILFQDGTSNCSTQGKKRRKTATSITSIQLRNNIGGAHIVTSHFKSPLSIGIWQWPVEDGGGVGLYMTERETGRTEVITLDFSNMVNQTTKDLKKFLSRAFGCSTSDVLFGKKPDAEDCCEKMKRIKCLDFTQETTKASNEQVAETRSHFIKVKEMEGGGTEDKAVKRLAILTSMEELDAELISLKLTDPLLDIKLKMIQAKKAKICPNGPMLLA